jgi:hypothetical protein
MVDNRRAPLVNRASWRDLTLEEMSNPKLLQVPRALTLSKSQRHLDRRGPESDSTVESGQCLIELYW